MALAIGAGLLASACGGGGNGDFSNASLVTLNTSSVPAGSTGQPYQAQLDATFPHPPGQYVITAGRLPPGVELNSLTGEISGYPRQLGRFNFDVSARDGLDPALPAGRDTTFSEAVKSFALDVTLGAPNILPQALPSAQYRHSFLYQIDVAGGTPPYTFTLLSGTLPTGISLTPDGRLGNFPTQANVAPGTPFEFDVQVKDALNQTDTAHFALNVVVLPLIIETSSLNEAAVGFPFEAQLKLASQGGGQPIVWSQVPPVVGEVNLADIGMEITADGIVRNSIAFPGPTLVGSHLFTIRVTDEASQVSTRQYTLKVNPGPFLTSIVANSAALPGPYLVSGGNFQPGAVLVFKPGPTEVVITPTFLSQGQLRFNNPPAAPGGGAVPVKVVNPDGGAHTKLAAFIFTADTIAFNGKGFISSGLSSTGLCCKDLNGDGLADVVHSGASDMRPAYTSAVQSTSGGLIYHRNLGTAAPSFASQTLDASNFYDCVIADVNVDGKPDIVGLAINQIKTFLNGVGGNPLGTFSAGPVSSLPTFNSGTPWPSCLALGRLNSDSIPDVVFGVSNGYQSVNANGSVYTMMGNGSGGFTLTASTTTGLTNTYGIEGIVVADSDGDGRDEICTATCLGYSVTSFMYYNPGTPGGGFGAWSARAGQTFYYGTTTGIAVGDFLGTGSPSVLAYHTGAPGYQAGTWFRLCSGAGFSSQTSVSPPADLGKGLCAIDADFDLKMDWALATKDSKIVVYKASTMAAAATMDASVGTPSLSTPFTGRTAAGDLDGDGRTDVLATTSCWLVEGMGLWQAGTTNYRLHTSGDGGNKGVVFYLNNSN